jgi:ankyrin repeat protein
MLVERGARLSARTHKERTALRYLLEHRYEEKLDEETVAQMLLQLSEREPSFDWSAADGTLRNTLLHANVLGKGAGQFVPLLLELGADVNRPNAEGERPLMLAVWRNLETTVSLLMMRGADPSLCNKRGQNAIDAAEETSPEMVLLVTAQLRLQNRIDQIDADLIHDAIHAFDEPEYIAEILDRNRELVHVRNNDNWTPMHTACSVGYRAVIELLFERGASVNSRTDNGTTPLHYYVQHHYADLDSAQRFLRESAERDRFDWSVQSRRGGDTLLHTAVSGRGDGQLVEFLLERGVPINQQNGEGNTALMIAAWRRLTDVVELLLQRGADVTPKNKDVMDVMDAAVEHGLDLVLLIREHLERLQWSKVRLVLAEMCDTQAQYAEGLRAVLEFYRRPMRTELRLSRRADLSIFANLEEVARVADGMSGALARQAALACTAEAADLSAVFAEWDSALARALVRYCGNLGVISASLLNLKTDARLTAWLDKRRRRHAELHMLDLDSQLIRPMQQLTRYPLFLNTLLHKAPSNWEAAARIRHTVARIEQILAQVQAKKRLRDLEAELRQKRPRQVPADAKLLFEAGVGMVEGRHRGVVRAAVFSGGVLLLLRGRGHEVVARHQLQASSAILVCGGDVLAHSSQNAQRGAVRTLPPKASGTGRTLSPKASGASNATTATAATLSTPTTATTATTAAAAAATTTTTGSLRHGGLCWVHLPESARQMEFSDRAEWLALRDALRRSLGWPHTSEERRAAGELGRQKARQECQEEGEEGDAAKQEIGVEQEQADRQLASEGVADGRMPLPSRPLLYQELFAYASTKAVLVKHEVIWPQHHAADPAAAPVDLTASGWMALQGAALPAPQDRVASVFLDLLKEARVSQEELTELCVDFVEPMRPQLDPRTANGLFTNVEDVLRSQRELATSLANAYIESSGRMAEARVGRIYLMLLPYCDVARSFWRNQSIMLWFLRRLLDDPFLFAASGGGVVGDGSPTASGQQRNAEDFQRLMMMPLYKLKQLKRNITCMLRLLEEMHTAMASTATDEGAKEAAEHTQEEEEEEEEEEVGVKEDTALSGLEEDITLVRKCLTEVQHLDEETQHQVRLSNRQVEQLGMEDLQEQISGADAIPLSDGKRTLVRTGSDLRWSHRGRLMPCSLFLFDDLVVVAAHRKRITTNARQQTMTLIAAIPLQLLGIIDITLDGLYGFELVSRADNSRHLVVAPDNVLKFSWVRQLKTHMLPFQREALQQPPPPAMQRWASQGTATLRRKGKHRLFHTTKKS